MDIEFKYSIGLLIPVLLFVYHIVISLNSYCSVLHKMWESIPLKMLLQWTIVLITPNALKKVQKLYEQNYYNAEIPQFYILRKKQIVREIEGRISGEGEGGWQKQKLKGRLRKGILITKSMLTWHIFYNLNCFPSSLLP